MANAMPYPANGATTPIHYNPCGLYEAFAAAFEEDMAMAGRETVDQSPRHMTTIKVLGDEKGMSKEYRYTTEISQMMFVFGEVRDPLTETVNLVEDIVRGRVVEINTEEDGDGAGTAIDEGQVDEATIKPRKMTVKLPWDIETVYSEVLGAGVNAEDEDEDGDEVEAHEDTIARLREADEATRRMTREEYVHYSECRSASFMYCKAERFCEFINLPAYLDIKPNNDTIDILGFLVFEMVRALCAGGLRS
ncbi:Transcription initiation protein spt3 [Ceratobasidium sp. 370]|nr:Transcription initiation protein spt3 [Ceratobasidium sp. 370]